VVVTITDHYPALPVGKEMLAGGLWLFTLEAPRLAQLARPGQFVHVRAGRTADPLLRRPFSIHRLDRAKGLVFLLVRETGRGTSLLAGETPRCLDVLGPLGRGFTLPDRKSSLAVVSGGMGAAPLVFLLGELAGHDVRVFAGARGRSFFPALADLAGFPFHPATDDGSLGYHGPVTDLFRAGLERWRPDLTYACGPGGMLRALGVILREFDLAGEFSLEEHMACGVGACQGCAVRMKDGLRLVCSDGPVFDAGEVAW
jgi:dihydroorotate dehydrogenase electron transfer subunit